MAAFANSKVNEFREFGETTIEVFGANIGVGQLELIDPHRSVLVRSRVGELGAGVGVQDG